ncbi:zingipain-2-like [Vicia villosa]|uniref:zingipain-2-like n=1 Tax=Vicia villosa TaxID=3911 RepID=UPI00273C432D|nr:zingipain-2-like [Vicia villosa]
MKIFTFIPQLPSLILLLSLSSFVSSSDTSKLFEEWSKNHGKTYASEEEKLHRFKVFEDNYAFVTQHNQMGNSSYTLSLNAFADLTHQEFKTTRLGLPPSLLRLKFDKFQNQPVVDDNDLLEVPSQVDWRESGAVTNVKDQGSCGACWSFSATGAIEGINKIVTGSLVSLSEQELVDCDTRYNSGCGGGLMDYAYQFIIENKGIDTEEDYPYEGRQVLCKKDKLKRRVVTIDGYTDVPSKDENKLLKAVAVQPVSVGICGSARAFQMYSKGIFTGPCSTSLDHAVLIVGYGSENGVDHWIVKNSWGKYWGMNGYIHILRNTESSAGICGINLLASYPTKTSPNPPVPPPPGPVRCNLFTHCSEGETCCCSWKFLGICFSWKCCGVSSAVCCKDKRHCCPQDYPICDTRNSQCLKRVANGTITMASDKEDTFHQTKDWSSQ